jgi:anti-anti-sigma regulatory factor
MLRLTLLSQNAQEAVLRIDGKLADDNVQILAAEGDRLFACTQRLVLNMQGVSFIDSMGLMLLEQWVKKGVSLHNGHFFVRELLKKRGLIQGGDL